MSHQRIIGIIVLLCLTLLLIPILKTTQQGRTNTSQAPQVMFPEKPANQEVTEITIDTSKVEPPQTANAVQNEATLEAPELPPLKPGNKATNKQTQTNTTPAAKKGDWVVQIASIKASNVISLTELKLALKNAGYQSSTQTTTLNGAKWVRFYSAPQANKNQALALKDKINRTLKKYRIQAVAKQL